jgi:hypothetical protein
MAVFKLPSWYSPSPAQPYLLAHFLRTFDLNNQNMRPITTYLTTLLLLTVTPLLAQKTKLATATLPDSVTAAYIDRPGELYVQTKKGILHRYDTDGNLKATAQDATLPTLFDPRDGARLFAYYRDKQQYTYLNPFFEAGILNPIDAAFAAEPWLACASGDYNIWVLDAADWSLKKIDTQKGIVLAETPVAGITADRREGISYMREYQGFLFVLERDHALHMYSGMGKHLRTLNAPGIKSFNVLGEDIYFQSGDQKVLFNLFSAKTMRIAMSQPADFALSSDEHLFVIRGKTLEIHAVPQN